MFECMLVPLDGSTLAERALKPALTLARVFGGQVVLLRVVAPEDLPLAVAPEIGYPDHELLQATQQRRWEEAEAYLARVRAEWQEQGIELRGLVAAGAPPEVIIAEQNRSKADLIVMSTHGRSGLGRLIYGSVAEAVLRGSEVPVLLVPVRK